MFIHYKQPPALQASPFFDRVVFSKVAARLGGKVKAIVNGGAPLAEHAEEFLRAAMCCPVVQVCMIMVCNHVLTCCAGVYDHRVQCTHQG
jgi:hypothetical protein